MKCLPIGLSMAVVLIGCRESSIRRSPGDPTAVLEFRIETSSQLTPAAVSFPDPSGKPILLQPNAVLRNSDIQSVVVEESHGRFTVGLRLVPSAAERLSRETTGNVGRRMAVLIDGKVVVAPVIAGAIASQARIDAGFSREEAYRVAHSLAPPAD